MCINVLVEFGSQTTQKLWCQKKRPNDLERGRVSFEEGNPNESDAKNLMIRENRQPRGIGCMLPKIPLTCLIWVENGVITQKE